MRAHLVTLLILSVAAALVGMGTYRNRWAQAELVLPRPMSVEEDRVLDVLRAYGHSLMVGDLEGLEQVAAPDYLEPHGVSGQLRQVRLPGVRAIVLEWVTPGNVPLDRAGFRRSYEYFYHAFPEVSSVRIDIHRLQMKGDGAEIDASLLVKGRSLLDGVARRPFENHARFHLRLRREAGRWYLLERRILSLQTWLL